VVTDPRGNLLGMITLEDLIETVIGSIHDEFDRDHRTRRMIDERNATQQA
jgi:CBS domain containing-hemolysin-like protein